MFSNGIVLLALVAALLIVAFDANVTRLIQLYILGVFLSFTLSQAGMVRHWSRADRGRRPERAARAAPQAGWSTALGAVATALVFVIVLVTKFAQGAWIVVLAAPILFVAMKAVSRHYRGIGEQLAPARRRAWRCRRASTPSSWSRTCWRRRCGRSPSPQATQPGHPARGQRSPPTDADDPLAARVGRARVPVPLVVIESPYRETVRPVLRYVRQLRREHPGDVISIVIPEYVVAHWWQHLLHNQTALRLKGRLLFEPSVTVTSVPGCSADGRSAR